MSWSAEKVTFVLINSFIISKTAKKFLALTPHMWIFPSRSLWISFGFGLWDKEKQCYINMGSGKQWLYLIVIIIEKKFIRLIANENSICCSFYYYYYFKSFEAAGAGRRPKMFLSWSCSIHSCVRLLQLLVRIHQISTCSAGIISPAAMKHNHVHICLPSTFHT